EMGNRKWEIVPGRPEICPGPISDFPRPLRGHPPISAVTVQFHDVWFAYDRPHSADGAIAPVEPESVLKGVSFEARPGRTLARGGAGGRRSIDPPPARRIPARARRARRDDQCG